ncbi:MAG: hypothetical protein ACJ72D_09970 [Marmoricola sp.]
MRGFPATLALGVTLSAAVVGCGSSSGDARTGAATPGNVILKALCPGVHADYDALVASDPASVSRFLDELRRLHRASNSEARAALDPVIVAAQGLREAGTGSGFYAARDAQYQAVVTLSGRCSAVGSPILHAGPHTGAP